jgi:hypothetical protein
VIQEHIALREARVERCDIEARKAKRLEQKQQLSKPDEKENEERN